VRFAREVAWAPPSVLRLGQVIRHGDVLLAFLALILFGDRLGRAHHLLIGIEQLLIRGDAVEIHIHGHFGAHIADADRTLEQSFDILAQALFCLTAHLLHAGCRRGRRIGLFLRAGQQVAAIVND